MNIKQPEPFTFEAGPRAVLLLHGFTGHTADVRMLGRFLQKKGYSSHAPIYRGHGKAPEELIKTTPDDWWEDVQQAYHHLKSLGYEEIAVAGLSLGGALGLKLANCNEVKAVIPMCTPMYFDNTSQLTNGFEHFATQYKQFEQKNNEQITKEVATLMEDSVPMFEKLRSFFTNMQKELDMIYAPAMVIQACQDEMINPESANYIYNQLSSTKKDLKWYEESGHVITMGKERDQLHEDIYGFLEALDWEEV